MEALNWLNKYKKIDFALNAFSNRKEIINYVKTLQKLGATVEIPWEENCEDDHADTLIIKMPTAMSKRFDIAVFILDGISPRPDEISSHIELMRHVDWKKDKSIVLWWD